MGLAALVSDALGVAPVNGGNPQPIAYSPEEQAADEAHDRTSGNLAELSGEIAKAKNPQIRATLQGELNRISGDAANSSPFAGLADTVSDALSGASEPAAPKPTVAPAKSPQTAVSSRFDLAKAPVAETIGTLATGAGSMIAGGLHGLYKLATGAGPEAAANAVTSTQEARTYQSQSEGAKATVGALASPWNPLNWPSVGAKYLSERASESKAGGGELATVLAPVAGLLEGGAALAAPGAFLKAAKGTGTVAKAAEVGAEASRFGSVGASATSNASALKAELASATPEFQQAVKLRKVPDAERNHEAMARQLEADSLPVPMKLTLGQAVSGMDTGPLSREMNRRASDVPLRLHIEEQPKQLLENVNAIREKAAPDVYGTNHVENGQALIDAYKATDEALRTDITAKYKALKDANGGQFPVDGKTFVRNAEEMLGKELKTEFVSPAIEKQMARFKEGAPMTFEQFEAMRTNLAAEIRKAERSGDGNAAYAAGVVRQALEELPLGGAQSFTTMSGGAAALKPIADAARAAAKARFDLLKKDPAYRAATNGTTAADDFIGKFVVRGKAGDVKTMVEHLGPGSVAHQTMSAGMINYLKAKAGIVNESGNFSQSGYNKALQELSPKLLDIAGPVTKKELETLGNVARYTQAQPRGSFVNNSNTFTAAAAEHAKGIAEGLANKATLGILPVGTMVREAAAKRAASKESMKSLQTGAGISLKDIGK